MASAAKAPPRWINSSKLPVSTMRPWSNTRMRVALRTVDSRWAITKVVRSFINSSSAACTFISVVASSALVASSRIRIGGFFTNARAIERRWRSPPESIRPRSPTLASKPSGLASMKSSACAFAAAARISSSVASGRPTRRFSPIERLNSNTSWNTTPMFRRSAESCRPRISMPSILIEPDCGSNTRCRSASAVDLPAPVGPTSAMISPGSAVNFRSVTAARLPS